MPIRRHLLPLLLIAVISPTLRAQTQPADPLMLLQQQDEERAKYAANAAQWAADFQRRQLQELHGTNGPGTHIAEVPKLAETLTDKQVKTALSAGVDYLLKRLATTITPDGGFRGIPQTEQHPWIGFAGDQQVGLVSLDIYALLEAGKFTADPRLRPSAPQMQPLIKWLERVRTSQTYSAALQASALAALPQTSDVQAALQKVSNDITLGMRNDGAFTYALAERAPLWDNSNTQYALLGIWAAAEAGVDIPKHFWDASDAHWRTTQSPSGGWSYLLPDQGSTLPDSNSTPTAALTAAGLASLYVTLDHRTANDPTQDRAIIRGLAAVAADFKTNLPLLGDDLYYTYALQRVGVASGLKYIDGLNWYRRAAAAIVLSQRPNGAWSYAYSELTGTAYALLILSHGGSPVFLNKLQYPGGWNGDPRDAANVVRQVGKVVEQPLNWQIVTLDGEAEDWLDAPVLLISGEGDPGFSPMELSKLKVFMEKGGLVFSVSLGGDAAFTAAMERYASAVVAGKYEGRRLPADHPLFTLNQKVENPPALWAISNGLRELWVHCPEYIGGALPVNLYVYVTGKGRPRNRLETLRVRMPEDVAGKRVINLACVEFAGQTDSEPAAWPRLAAMMPAETNFLVKVTQVPLLKLDAHDTPVAHMTGLEKFELSAEERQQLQTYLDSGGTVIADAAGGSEAFAGSFESMVGALKGPQKGGVVGGAQAFLARAQAQMAAVGRFRKSTPPARRTADGSEVEVWRMGDREAIYFFPLDVTSGLLGTETWGISGYTPETSQVLARDLLLYATRTAPGSTSR